MVGELFSRLKGVQHQPDEITILVWCEEHTKHI
jgi:hypothetical protein